MRASEKKLKQNNKGFTLVELVAAVAIMALVSAPIIHAFITSATNTKKARSVSEATIVCQNVQETVKTCTIDEFTDFRDPADRMLRGASLESCVTTGNDKVVKLRNIQGGEGRYDATITFTEPKEVNGAGTPIGLHAINAKDVVEYTDMTGVYSQSVQDTANPDVVADNLFQSDLRSVPFDKNVTKSRTITINTTSSEANGTKKVYVDVVYSYSYDYYKNGILQQPYKTSMSFAVFPSGRVVEAGETSSAYVMYFPNYTFDSRISHTDIDNIVINNKNDENVRYYIIKQAMPQGNESMITANNAQLSALESVYLANITVYHSSQYQNKVAEDDSVYTNACRNLATGANLPAAQFGFNIIAGSWSYSRNEQITGEIVSESPTTRIWNVKIQVFPTGSSFNESNELLYEYTGTKLTD